MAISDLVDSGSNVAGTGGLVALAYGAVRLYRRLMNDSDAAWDKRLAELRAERDQDRERWDEDRTKWAEEIQALRDRTDRCHEENAQLTRQIGELKGQIAGLQYQLDAVRGRTKALEDE